MHQIHWGSLQHSPDPLSGLRGRTSKGKGHDEKERDREGRGKGREGEGRKESRNTPPAISVYSPDVHWQTVAKCITYNVSLSL